MYWEQTILIAAGFIILSLSAKETITRLEKIARHIGVSEFSISFLVVGLLSIFPELIIGIDAALHSKPSFGLGIALGSNIADLTLIVGLVAIFANGIKTTTEAKKDLKILVLCTLLPLLLLIDGEISRIDGAVLLAAFSGYVLFIVTSQKNKQRLHIKSNLALEIPTTIVFVAAMLFAGNLIVDNTAILSENLSMPLFFLGVIIAAGTCMPELTFAIQSAAKKHQELGFGNILGNVFADSMATIGIIAIISPIKPTTPQLAIISASIMALCAALLYAMLRKNNRITKTAGIALVITYVFLVVLQFLSEQAIVK